MMRIHKIIPLLTVVVFVLLHVFAYPGTRFSNDSYRYARSAYEFLGDPYRKAQDKALRAYCADTAAMLQRNRMLHQIEFRAPVRSYEFQDCLTEHADGLNPSNPRYEALFHARLAYPLVAAPFVWLLGAKAGLTAVALGFTALGGLLVLVLLRALRAPPPVAWLGQCLYYVTPIGLWGSRPMTEGPMIALMVAMLLGAVWLCQGRRRVAGALLSVGAFALGFAVKYSSFALVGPCLVAASALALMFVPQARHKGTRCLLIVSLFESLVAFAMSRALRLPGLEDSLQDTFSLHWTYAEVADPWRRLARLDVNYWWQWLQGEALAPSLLFLLALGIWGAMSRSVPIALCLIAVGGTGLLTSVAHPVAMEGDRLYVQVWLIVVVGLPLLVERLRRSGGTPGAPPVRSDRLLMKTNGRRRRTARLEPLPPTSRLEGVDMRPDTHPG
ncbi:hypothetical protein [Streptomyces sp. NPDC097640]|uniref:hypothetical protein n=1 Tax=Streptomyces sp. NPDC097640 TaxID=3157229 RepID=UPI0033278BEA